MNERARLWDAARELASAGTLGALATVARHRGSLPMAHDAKMVVAADGCRWGTVGGGCTEAEVTEQALAAAGEGKPRVVRHTLNADLAGDLGLSCGGTVELFLEPVVASAEMARLLGAVAEAIERRRPATVVTAMDWSAGPAKAVYAGDAVVAVAGNASAPPLPRAPQLPRHRVTVSPRGRTVAFMDEQSGTFVEPITRTPRVIIFGAGHVGTEIARVAAGAGFCVVITDDRADFAHRERVPWADAIIVDDFRVVLERLELDEDDYVLATTRGHSYDAYIIEKTAPSPAGYVGMLGSKRKRAVIFKALRRAGVPEEALARVHVPIGDEIGAETPGEIAVSVVAQLIRYRRFGEARREGD